MDDQVGAGDQCLPAGLAEKELFLKNVDALLQSRSA